MDVTPPTPPPPLPPRQAGRSRPAHRSRRPAVRAFAFAASVVLLVKGCGHDGSTKRAAARIAGTTSTVVDAQLGRPAPGARAPEEDPGLHRRVADAFEGGRDWLVAHQNQDGSFGSFKTERWYEISASISRRSKSTTPLTKTRRSSGSPMREPWRARLWISSANRRKTAGS